MFTSGKINNAMKRLIKQHTFAITNSTLASEDK